MIVLSASIVIATTWTIRGNIPSNLVQAALNAFDMVVGAGKPLVATGDTALNQGESVNGTLNITNN